MKTAVIDYGSGNLRSAAKALELAARDLGPAMEIIVTGDAKIVAAADYIVLPGVGAFRDCMAGLDALDGMRDALQQAVINAARPFLGICVGMQLMADRGIEHGELAGFGWIEGEVAIIEAAGPELKIPHMGWNELVIDAPGHPVLAGIAQGAHMYFVHSYALTCTRAADVLAHVDYGGALVAVAGRDNLVGTQFHPEKSQATGLALLRNFLSWRP